MAPASAGSGGWGEGIAGHLDDQKKKTYPPKGLGVRRYLGIWTTKQKNHPTKPSIEAEGGSPWLPPPAARTHKPYETYPFPLHNSTNCDMMRKGWFDSADPGR